ncbi:hypothetical protein HDU82_000104 [Entophlyctis luteolus]|nr:hypothetical protein HDU82_000104 [Entophlyctis luteolus]
MSVCQASPSKIEASSSTVFQLERSFLMFGDAAYGGIDRIIVKKDSILEVFKVQTVYSQPISVSSDLNISNCSQRSQVDAFALYYRLTSVKSDAEDLPPLPVLLGFLIATPLDAHRSYHPVTTPKTMYAVVAHFLGKLLCGNQQVKQSEIDAIQKSLICKSVTQCLSSPDASIIELAAAARMVYGLIESCIITRKIFLKFCGGAMWIARAATRLLTLSQIFKGQQWYTNLERDLLAEKIRLLWGAGALLGLFSDSFTTGLTKIHEKKRLVREVFSGIRTCYLIESPYPNSAEQGDVAIACANLLDALPNILYLGRLPDTEDWNTVIDVANCFPSSIARASARHVLACCSDSGWTAADGIGSVLSPAQKYGIRYECAQVSARSTHRRPLQK